MSLLESMLGRIGVVDDEGPCKFRSDRYDVTFTVSTESHDVAYAVPVSAAELDALAELVRIEGETPYVEEGNDSLSEALESALGEDSIDAEAWVERMAEPRRTVEPIVETWRELATANHADTPDDSDAADGDDTADQTDGDEADGGERDDDAADQTDGASSNDVPGAAAEWGSGPRDALDVTVVYLPVGMESAVASFFDLCRRRAERESDPFAFPEDVGPAAGLLSRISAATERAENRVVVNTRHLPLETQRTRSNSSSDSSW